MTVKMVKSQIRGMSREDIDEMTLKLEELTGHDSVPTITTHYEDQFTSTFMCPFPACSFRRASPVEMWIHVHLSQKHPPDEEMLENIYDLVGAYIS